MLDCVLSTLSLALSPSFSLSLALSLSLKHMCTHTYIHTHTQIRFYHMIGNAVAPPVIEAIAKQMLATGLFD